MSVKILKVEITHTRHWWTIGNSHFVFANESDWPADKKNERGLAFDGKGTHYRLEKDEKYILKSDVLIIGALDENGQSVTIFPSETSVVHYDPVNHPFHYTFMYEVCDIIMDWKLSFIRGQVVKYVARAGKKDGVSELEDLKKAAWYLNREIEKLENVK